MMKIVTILKQVPDAEARIRVSGTAVDLEGVTFVIDGMDEYGVEQALRIREGGSETEIIAVALGPPRFEDAIRTALAMGVDRAIHIETEERLDPITQAKILATTIGQEGADLVFVGGKEADWDSAALGPAIAERLGWPHSDWTTQLRLEEGRAAVVHDSDDGSEALSVPLPAVITTQQGLNEPRYPTLPNIMKARRKELLKRDLSAFASLAPKTTVLSEEIQTSERLNRLFMGSAEEVAAELIAHLRDEAKVI